MKRCSILKRVSACINSFLESSFEKYADLAYSRPYIVILLSLFLIVSFGYGNVNYSETDEELDLWIPEDAQSLKDLDSLDEVYEISYLAQTVFVIGKEEGTNILTKNAFEELLDFEEVLWSDFLVEGLRYNDVCFKLDESQSNEAYCETKDSPLLFFLNSDASFDRSSLSSDSSLLEKINSGKGTLDFFPEGSKLFISVKEMFGTTIPSFVHTSEDGTNDIQESKAIRWNYYIKDDYSDSKIDRLHEEFEHLIKEFNKSSNHVNIYPMSNSLRRREYVQTIEEDTRLVYPVAGILFLYSLYVVGQLNTYRSRLLIGAVGLFSVVLAYFEAIGLGTYIGLQGNPLTSTIIFLLLGIGLDDMFVLLSCLNKAPLDLDGKERFKHMMKSGGVSITITSLTNMCAFAIGSVTSFPGVRTYCILLTFGMIFDYINQITLFLGFLACDIRRSEKERGDCCGLVFCKPRSKSCCKGKYIFDDSGRPQTPVSQIIIEKYYGKFLMNKYVKGIVLGVFLCLLALNIYGLTQIEINYNIEWFIKGDHYIYNAIRIRDDFFDTNIETTYFYTINAAFEDEEVQVIIDKLEDFIDECEGCEDKWIEEGSTISWYSAFKDWISRGNCVVESNLILLEGEVVPSEFFYECLGMWSSEDEGILYKNMLAWEGSTLKGAAIEAKIVIPSDAQDTIRAVEDTREIAEKGPDETFPLSNIYYRGDHHSVILYEALLGIGCALGVVFFILMIALADVAGSILSLSMVALTVVGQLSLLHFWGEYLNFLTVTNTIMAIGVSVDYSAHFIHAYKHTNEDDKDAKVIRTLGSIGISIFNGFMSTFLSIFPLQLSSHFPFVIFFKNWFGILVYSVLHALVLLPVLLSFIKFESNRVEAQSSCKEGESIDPEKEKL